MKISGELRGPLPWLLSEVPQTLREAIGPSLIINYLFSQYEFRTSQYLLNNVYILVKMIKLAIWREGGREESACMLGGREKSGGGKPSEATL